MAVAALREADGYSFEGMESKLLRASARVSWDNISRRKGKLTSL